MSSPGLLGRGAKLRCSVPSAQRASTTACCLDARVPCLNVASRTPRGHCAVLSITATSVSAPWRPAIVDLRRTKMVEQAVLAPRGVATRVFEALNRHDLDVAMDHVHPDAVDDIVVLGRFEGREAVRGFFSELFGALPDFQLE